MAPRQEVTRKVARSGEILPDVEAALDAEVAQRRLPPETPQPGVDGDPKPVSPLRRTLARVRSYLDAADMDAAEREADFHEGDDRWSSA